VVAWVRGDIYKAYSELHEVTTLFSHYLGIGTRRLVKLKRRCVASMSGFCLWPTMRLRRAGTERVPPAKRYLSYLQTSTTPNIDSATEVHPSTAGFRIRANMSWTPDKERSSSASKEPINEAVGMRQWFLHLSY
jgi:hypothetical protein